MYLFSLALSEKATSFLFFFFLKAGSFGLNNCLSALEMADFHHAFSLPNYFLNCSPLLSVLEHRSQSVVASGFSFSLRSWGESLSFSIARLCGERGRPTRPGGDAPGAAGGTREPPAFLTDAAARLLGSKLAGATGKRHRNLAPEGDPCRCTEALARPSPPRSLPARAPLGRAGGDAGWGLGEEGAFLQIT